MPGHAFGRRRGGGVSGIERALTRGNLRGPVGRDRAWTRSWSRRRGSRRLRSELAGVRRILAAAIEFVGAVTVLGDDLVEPAVQPGHGIGKMPGALVGLGECIRIGVGAGHALEMPRQRFEAFLDRGKLSANGVLAAVSLGM